MIKTLVLNHPWIKNKKVNPRNLSIINIDKFKENFGLDIRKEYDRDFWQGEDSLLVVPLKDINGMPQSMQFINSKGIKRFLYGRGGFYIMGKPSKADGYILMLCIGYSDGDALNKAKNCFTICYMGDIDGFLDAAKAVRAKHPKAKIIICAKKYA